MTLFLLSSYGKAYDSTMDNLLELASVKEISNEMIPASIKDLGYYAIDGVLFLHNTLIRYPMNKEGTVYRIPEGITGVNEDAFDRSGACELREIYIPASCIDIGYDYTYYFTWGYNTPFGDISVYQVSKDNPYFTTDEGVLFSKEKDILLQYPIANERDTYSIPDGVRRIEERAFMQCKLVHVDFPDSLRSIGREAFYVNTIKTLLFNEGLQSIESGAFNASNLLETVAFPSTLLYIGDYAFSQCFQLHHVSLPEGLAYIDAWAFCGDPIEKLLLPDSLLYIGYDICGYSTSTSDYETPFYYVYRDSYAHLWVKRQSGILYDVIE